MQCPNCNAPISEGDRFCEDCGTPLFANQTLPCPKCETGQLDGEGFCNSCGFRSGESSHARIVLTHSPQLAAASDPGLKHFPNQDAAAIAQDSTRVALVVCDGVSSSDRPERASQLAAATTCDALAQGHDLVDAIALAIEAVQQLPSRGDEDPASTTLVAALVQNSLVQLGWIGDSRAYWVSQGAADPGTSQCLTQDHSWANQMVASGQMTREAASQSTHAHAITHWIGADNREDSQPDLTTFEIPGPGWLVLCSDGLWNYLVHNQDLPQLIRAAPGPDATSITNHLVDFARARGGHDNITVAVYQIDSA
jgi:PPM family protein phosphatase